MTMFHRIFVVLALVVVFTGLAGARESRAATVTAVQTGDWTDSATWGGVVPVGADDVVIPATVTVTIPADNSLFIRSGSTSIYGTLLNNHVIYQYGSFTNYGTLVNNTSINNFSGVFDNRGTLSNNWWINAFYGGATILNNGTFNNNTKGGIYVGVASAPKHDSFSNNATFNNSGQLINYDLANNAGTFNQYCGASISGGNPLTGNPVIIIPC